MKTFLLYSSIFKYSLNLFSDFHFSHLKTESIFFNHIFILMVLIMSVSLWFIIDSNIWELSRIFPTNYVAADKHINNSFNPLPLLCPFNKQWRILDFTAFRLITLPISALLRVKLKLKSYYYYTSLRSKWIRMNNLNWEVESLLSSREKILFAMVFKLTSSQNWNNKIELRVK